MGSKERIDLCGKVLFPEGGNTFVECFSSDLESREAFSSAFCGICGSVTHRESRGEDFLVQTHITRLPSSVCHSER